MPTLTLTLPLTLMPTLALTLTRTLTLRLTSIEAKAEKAVSAHVPSFSAGEMLSKP